MDTLQQNVAAKEKEVEQLRGEHMLPAGAIWFPRRVQPHLAIGLSSVHLPAVCRAGLFSIDLVRASAVVFSCFRFLRYVGICSCFGTIVLPFWYIRVRCGLLSIAGSSRTVVRTLLLDR